MGVFNSVPGVSAAVLVTLFQNYFFLKGCVGAICLYGSLPLLYFRGLTAVNYQRFRSIALLPRALKAWVAAISDTYPIGGHYKRYYLLGSTILMTLALVAVAVSTTVEMAVGFLTICSACFVTIDTLYEGLFANLVSFFGADKRLVSYVWGFTMSGTIVGALIVGVFGGAENSNGSLIWIAFVIGSVLVLQCIIPLIFYPSAALPHDDVTPKGTIVDPLLDADQVIDANGYITHSFSSFRYTSVQSRTPNTGEWVLVSWLALSSFLLIIVLAATGNEEDKVETSMISLLIIVTGGVSMGIAYRLYSDRKVYLCALVYVYLHSSLCIDISGIQDAYFTAPDHCVLNGPNFSLMFYISTISVIAGIVGTLVTVLYNRKLIQWTTRSIVQFALLLKMFGSLFDISIVTGWNEKHLGISNHAFFIFGDAIISPTAFMLITIAMAVLVSNVVYKGRATTTYAILGSFQYLGESTSQIIGMLLAKGMDIRASRHTGCDFSNFVSLIILTKIVSVYLALTLAYALVPNIRFTPPLSSFDFMTCSVVKKYK